MPRSHRDRGRTVPLPRSTAPVCGGGLLRPARRTSGGRAIPAALSRLPRQRQAGFPPHTAGCARRTSGIRSYPRSRCRSSPSVPDDRSPAPAGRGPPDGHRLLPPLCRRMSRVCRRRLTFTSPQWLRFVAPAPQRAVGRSRPPRRSSPSAARGQAVPSPPASRSRRDTGSSSPGGPSHGAAPARASPHREARAQGGPGTSADPRPAP